MSAAVLGLALGAAVGLLMARRTVCFNAALRKATFERDRRILRIFAVAVAAQLLLVPLVVAADVPVSRIGLVPVPQLLGGLVFGVGMALAGGCITGILWKTGAGSLATGLAIGGFAGGELLARGPGAELLERAQRAGGRPDVQTLHGLVDVPYAPLAVVLGALALWALLRRSRAGAAAGVALGALSALTWVAADAVGYGYGLGFTGAAENIRASVAATDAGRLSFQAFLAAGVVLGGLVALRGPVRRPDAVRAARSLAGGVLMGVGANVAFGCNIGHGLVGVPLLSLGSMLATAAIAAGALMARGVVLEPFPALRGRERPEPNW